MPFKTSIIHEVNRPDSVQMTVNRTLRSDMSAVQNRLREISDRYRVDIIYSFGSRAHEVRDFLSGQGEWDKSITSDVDPAVKVAPDMASMSVREKVGLTAELEDLLGAQRVDLVILSESDPFLSANIVRGERIFCRDPYLADEYELYILRRAGDLAPLELERLSIVFTNAG